MTIQILLIFMFSLNVFAQVKPRFITPQELKQVELLRQQEASRTPAQKCSKKDFSKQLGPVSTQGVGNCYAYQAADLLTHKLKLKPPEQVSATELSIRFSTFNKEFTRLTAMDSIDWARLTNIKTDSRVFKTLQKIIFKGLNKNIDEEINFFKEFRNETQNAKSILDIMDFGGTSKISINLVNEDNNLCISNELDQYGQESDLTRELIAWMKLEKLAECNNANDLQNFRDIALTNQSIHQLIVKKYCKNIKINEPVTARDVQLKKKLSDGSVFIDQQTSKQTIDELLDHNQIAGINYHPKFMVKDDIGQHAKHASSIVGREFRDGQCWYMVRNSWGPSCDGYVTKIDPKDPKPDIDCKNGGEIWIREDQLLPNIYRLTYIE